MYIDRLLDEPVLPPGVPLPTDRPFTYRTARHEAGLTQRDLTRLVRSGHLRRPIQGVYVVASLPDSLDLRCACLRLVVPSDAVVCDRHAGWLHGATMVLAPNEHLELAPVSMYLPPGRRLRNALSQSGERALLASDIVETNGLLVTTPLRTACDLGRNRWPERSLAGMDQMLRLGAFTHEQLLDGVRRFRGMRWVRVLRALAPYADGRSESPGESVLRLRWIEVNLPTPIPQYEVWDGGQLVARLDIANPDAHFAAEYDGEEWHSSEEQRSHDHARRRAVEERGGIHVVAFRKENLFGPQQDAEGLLLAGAAEARRRYGPLLP